MNLNESELHFCQSEFSLINNKWSDANFSLAKVQKNKNALPHIVQYELTAI